MRLLIGPALLSALPALAQTTPATDATLPPMTDQQIFMVRSYTPPRRNAGTNWARLAEIEAANNRAAMQDRPPQSTGPTWGASTMTNAERDRAEHKARMDKANSEWEKRQNRTGH
jgi:hypothetical protein